MKNIDKISFILKLMYSEINNTKYKSLLMRFFFFVMKLFLLSIEKIVGSSKKVSLVLDRFGLKLWTEKTKSLWKARSSVPLLGKKMQLIWLWLFLSMNWWKNAISNAKLFLLPKTTLETLSKKLLKELSKRRLIFKS